MSAEFLLIMCNILLEQAMEKQNQQLSDVSNTYEQDKKFWVASVNELDNKIKVNI